YMQHHKTLDHCIHDALNYDDNCDRERAKNDASSKASGSSMTASSQIEEKIKQIYGQPRAYEQRMANRPDVLQG
ncbi:hypothetical protein, partial [Escherichia coli]|uniref:hypothetical protein n=1 Tax=Escherichia coli TaxID=562 RepID=UPI001AD8E2C9